MSGAARYSAQYTVFADQKNLLVNRIFGKRIFSKRIFGNYHFEVRTIAESGVSATSVDYFSFRLKIVSLLRLKIVGLAYRENQL